MGIEVAGIGLGTILSGVSAVSSIIGGFQQSREAEEQARLARADAEARARAEARDAIEFEGRQKLAFLKSGVALTGTPLAVLAETRSRGLENVRNVIDSGERTASSIRTRGRSALIGGLTEGIGTLAGGIGSISPSSPTPPIPPRKPLLRPLPNPVTRL